MYKWSQEIKINGPTKSVAILSQFGIVSILVSPTDPAIRYRWCDVGMLDFDPDTKLYLVQKANSQGRITDSQGNPVVNGGMQEDG